jgi:hypothetical protein
VVDLKTGRSAPSNKSVESHRQLALYQLAIDSGALDSELGEGAPARSGGAELVQLGSLDDGPAQVQEQPAATDDGPVREGLRSELGLAAGLVRLEVFPAVPGQTQCRDCAFVPICPAKSAGSVISQ